MTPGSELVTKKEIKRPPYASRRISKLIYVKEKKKLAQAIKKTQKRKSIQPNKCQDNDRRWPCHQLRSSLHPSALSLVKVKDRFQGHPGSTEQDISTQVYSLDPFPVCHECSQRPCKSSPAWSHAWAFSCGTWCQTGGREAAVISGEGSWGGVSLRFGCKSLILHQAPHFPSFIKLIFSRGVWLGNFVQDESYTLNTMLRCE